MTLAEIAADRESGAAEVADDLLSWCEAWAEGAGGTPGEVAKELAGLARSQSALAPVLRIANDLLVALDLREDTEESASRAALGELAVGWRKRLRAAAESVGLHLRRSLEGVSTVYTYSASSTVSRALEAHAKAGNWFKVVCSESRPGGEGSRMAMALAEAGVPVRIGIDMWLLDTFEEEGNFIVGADALMPTAWVNKLGTGALAQRARDKGVPVVVVADTSKWLPTALAIMPRLYDRDPDEIIADRPKSLSVENPYFEEIPYDRVDRLITERGVTRPTDLRSGDVPVATVLRTFAGVASE